MPRKEHQISLNIERARYWLGTGAQPSETVRSIFRRLGVYEGDWQKPKAKRDRSGRKTQTKSRAARVGAKEARASKKLERRKHRLTEKRAAAKAAAAEKKEEAKA
jgi:small subunit ribosomal protein S16